MQYKSLHLPPCPFRHLKLMFEVQNQSSFSPPNTPLSNPAWRMVPQSTQKHRGCSRVPLVHSPPLAPEGLPGSPPTPRVAPEQGGQMPLDSGLLPDTREGQSTGPEHRALPLHLAQRSLPETSPSSLPATQAMVTQGFPLTNCPLQ